MDSGDYYKIVKFNGKNNFNLWKVKVQAVLKQKGVYDVVFEPDQLAKELTEPKKRDMEMRAHSSIQLALTDEVLSEVIQESTAAGLWKRLETLYMTKSLTNRLYMLRQLYALRMREGGTLTDVIAELNRLVIDLRSVEEKVSDEHQAIILLNSLNPEFENFVETMLNGKDKITLEEVKAALHTKSLRSMKVDSGKGEDPQALVSTGHSRRRGGQGTSKGTPKNACFLCKQSGHWRKDCPKLKEGSSGGGKDAAHVGIASGRELDEDISDGDILTASSSFGTSDSWLLDSGCSQHMTPDRSAFATYIPSAGKSFQMGNGVMCKQVGCGTVPIRMHDGRVRVLHDVRHIPELRCSLISIGALAGRGCRAVIERDHMRVFKGKFVVMRGRQKDNLYVLDGRTARKQELCGVLSTGPCRRGHLKNVSVGVWGPAPVVSREGARYVAFFMDDFSNKVWISLMKARNELVGKFQLWRQTVETEMGSSVQMLRSNEEVMIKYCESVGAACQYTKEGGFLGTERTGGIIKVLLEKTQSLLQPSRLPKEFWSDAISTAVHLINRTPPAPVGSKISEELWTGKVVDMSYLRTFGSLVCTHKDHNARQGDHNYVLVGYAGGTKRYRLWCPKSQKILVRRQVNCESAMLRAEQTNIGGVVRRTMDGLVRSEDEIQIMAREDDPSGHSTSQRYGVTSHMSHVAGFRVELALPNMVLVGGMEGYSMRVELPLCGMQLPRQLHSGLSSVLACCVQDASLGTWRSDMVEMCRSQRFGEVKVGVANEVYEDAPREILDLERRRLRPNVEFVLTRYRKRALLDAIPLGRRFSFPAMKSWKAEHHVGLKLLKDSVGVKRGVFGLMGDCSSLKGWVVHGSTAGDILYTGMVYTRLVMSTGVAKVSTSKTDVAIARVVTRMQMVGLKSRLSLTSLGEC